MAEEVAFDRLVRTDWSALCPTNLFCFGCSSPVCSHCCNRHGHQGRHHGAEADPILIESIGGRPAMEATSAQRCGYDTTGIQRIKSGGRKYILLCPVQRDDLRCHNMCLMCGRRIKRGCHWCSLGCKAANAEGGSRRPAAELLATLAAAGQFGPPLLHKDRFCMICRHAYSSASCPEHLQRHHPQHPAAGPGSIKNVLHFDGWAAVPHGQLPAHLVQDVQVLHHHDGTVAHAVHRRPAQAHHNPVPVHMLGVGGMAHACHRAGCHEVFWGPQRFCSLRCCHQQDG